MVKFLQAEPISTFDEYYQYDRLNRLSLMQRGTLNGTKTGISGTPTKVQGSKCCHVPLRPPAT